MPINTTRFFGMLADSRPQHVSSRMGSSGKDYAIAPNNFQNLHAADGASLG
jgi:hypothetical protein